MFARSTIACLVLSFVLVAAIAAMAYDAVQNVREYLAPASSKYAVCTYEDGNGDGYNFILCSPDNIEYVCTTN